MNAGERAQARVRWGDLLPRQLAFLTVYAECANIAMARPMVSKGRIVCYVQEYSDTLMAILLAGRRPEKYSKQRLEHRGTVRLGVEEDLTQLSGEELAQYRALAFKAQRTPKALETGA